MPSGKSSFGGVGHQIFKKAYITRFVLDVSKPEKFQLLSKDLATIDAHGYVINVHLLNLAGVMFAYRRGVMVARSDSNGQSQGLDTWSEQRTVSTLFCILG